MQYGALTLTGMNDVLPKPFTKEGLLNMLEKHLAHLKKPTAGLGMGPLGPTSIIPQKRSLKSDDSPATSPATGSAWTSPGGLTGLSPASHQHDDPYGQAVHPAGPPFSMPPHISGAPPPGAFAAGAATQSRGPLPPNPLQRPR